MKPYFVIDIKNSPVPSEVDVYYIKADYTSRAIEIIEPIIDSLEVGGEPVTISARVVELNDEQEKYLYESSDFDGGLEFDISKFEALGKKEVGE